VIDVTIVTGHVISLQESVYCLTAQHSQQQRASNNITSNIT